jgi:hypothetical protein
VREQCTDRADRAEADTPQHPVGFVPEAANNAATQKDGQPSHQRQSNQPPFCGELEHVVLGVDDPNPPIPPLERGEGIRKRPEATARYGLTQSKLQRPAGHVKSVRAG